MPVCGARILNKGPKVRRYDKMSWMTGSPLHRAYTWLEPDERKLSCPVLRGGSVSNGALLPDFNGLYGLVRDHLSCDPESGHVFLLTNARRNRLKLLVYDGSWLWVCAKSRGNREESRAKTKTWKQQSGSIGHCKNPTAAI